MFITTNTVLFHWMQKALGLAPYILKGETYSVFWLMSLYSAGFFGLMVTYLYYCSTHTFIMPGVSFSSYVTCLTATLSLFQLIFRQSAAVNAHNELISASYALKKYTQINYENLGIERMIEFVLSSALVCGISVYMVKSTENSEWYCCLAVVYSQIVRVVLVNQFTWMTHVINTNLSAVNELVTREQIYLTEDLNEVAYLHQRFTACGEITNQAFSMALLWWSIESFTKICYCTYHLCVCALYPEFVTCGPARGESAFGLVWYLIEYCYMVRLCQLITTSVTSSSTTIHEILRTVETSDDVTHKLEQWSFQLVPRFFFSATGFFILDYGFLTTLAGLVTTYVIIFVQFFVMDNANILPDPKEIESLLERFS